MGPGHDNVVELYIESLTGNCIFANLTSEPLVVEGYVDHHSLKLCDKFIVRGVDYQNHWIFLTTRQYILRLCFWQRHDGLSLT